jgi:hypothetical protein
VIISLLSSDLPYREPENFEVRAPFLKENVMSISAKTQRDRLRLVHLAGSAMLGAYVYSPWADQTWFELTTDDPHFRGAACDADRFVDVEGPQCHGRAEERPARLNHPDRGFRPVSPIHASSRRGEFA